MFNPNITSHSVPNEIAVIRAISSPYMGTLIRSNNGSGRI
jgi:hypothetical protein